MKKFTGIVTKTNNAKTAHVKISTEWVHPKYLKKIKKSTVFACHDTVGTQVGDEVEIVECRPLSATKHFTVSAVTKQGAAVLMTAQKKEKKTTKVAKKTTKKGSK